MIVMMARSGVGATKNVGRVKSTFLQLQTTICRNSIIPSFVSIMEKNTSYHTHGSSGLFAVFHSSFSTIATVESKTPQSQKSQQEQQHKQQVLQLYRQCLKAINTIENEDWKETYRIRVRDGFRTHKSFTPKNRTCQVKIQETQEELDRFMYFLTLSQIRNSQGEQAALKFMNDTEANQKLEEQKITTITDTIDNTPTAAAALTLDTDNSLSSTITENGIAVAAKSRSHGAADQNIQDKYQIVQGWLHSIIPSLHLEDVQYYTECFIQDGFDSIEMLEHELNINDDEDLHFMKKAHVRAFRKEIRNRQEQGQEQEQ